MAVRLTRLLLLTFGVVLLLLTLLLPPVLAGFKLKPFKANKAWAMILTLAWNGPILIGLLWLGKHPESYLVVFAASSLLRVAAIPLLVRIPQAAVGRATGRRAGHQLHARRASGGAGDTDPAQRRRVDRSRAGSGGRWPVPGDALPAPHAGGRLPDGGHLQDRPVQDGR